MTHIDDDALALVALGTGDLTPAEAEHLASCDTCSQELDALRRTVHVGRESQGVTLERPSPDVWQRIVDEVSGSQAAPQAATVMAPPVVTPVAAPQAAPVAAPVRPLGDHVSTHRAPRRSRGRRIRLSVWIPVTAVIAIAAAVGGFVASPSFDRSSISASTVVEVAQLRALPDWQGAHGTATLSRASDGRLTLSIRMTPGSAHPASIAGPLREVWLMKSDLSGLVSVGFLTADSGTFAVPAGIDTAAFGLVDISAQAANGDPGHSGQSIMRGRLRSSSA